MQTEAGDDYVRRYAGIIRANERRLANAGPNGGPGGAAEYLNPLSWVNWTASSAASTPRRGPPAMLQLDLHHLYYLLIRFEGLSLPVGSLDIKLRSSSRPVSYTSLLAAKDRSDTLSLSSFTSAFSSISKLSLGGSWFAREIPPVDLDVKYIYSSFTILPALSLKASDLRVIAELRDEPSVDNAVPMYSFKNLRTLEVLDVDPRTLLGWDQLSESLRSLTIKRSGIEEVTDLIINAVLDDQTRRERDASATSPSSPLGRRPLPSRFSSGRSHRGSVNIPDALKEDVEAHAESPSEEAPRQLSPLKWRLLRHLSFADNALTFFPSTPLTYLTSLTHLDLSSNLLVSVPPGLSSLYNLVSLNLADNMIDSVLGIYAHLGQVLTLNLDRNRLESICGLERLMALERVDLRSNHIIDPGEIGRLAVLPNIAEVWVEGNPMTEIDEQYRVHCFEFFAQEKKNMLLDGTAPSFLESRAMRVTPPDSLPEERDLEAKRRSAASPPVVSVGGTSPSSMQPQRTPRRLSNAVAADKDKDSPPSAPPTAATPSPNGGLGSPPLTLSGAAKPVKKRKPKRLVDFDADGTHSDASSNPNNPSDSSPLGLQPKRSSKHRRGASESVTSSNLMPENGGLLPSAEIAGPSPSNGEPTEEEAANGMSQADAYRAKIEALRREVGDSWLKVLSQSGGLPPGASANTSAQGV
ncbi:hypothetical protein DL93DRAFT_2052510 [Clavulina sp. PMI_390]|nr:hypothetical protein DL93DRAFT_2052510 [Clavulina sp. PMI_390]